MKARSFNGFTTVPGHVAMFGGGLLFEMKEAKPETIKRFLGTSMRTQRKRKYSDSVYVRHNDTGFMYSVYMSFGEWRIGVVNTAASFAGPRNGTYTEIAHKLRELLES